MPDYKNRFKTPVFREETILDIDGKVVGTIRIKPSSVLWKPKGAHQFFSVSLEDFAEWVTAESTKARKTKS